MMNNTNVTDMTVGSPAAHIIKFTLPLLLGNFFQQLYNMVDSIVVGNFVGADALAAVGVCGPMSFLLFSLSSGLAIGIGVIVSQFFGAGDEENVKNTIANSIYVLAGASILVSILGIIWSPDLLSLLKTPDTIIKDSVIYMRTTCMGILFIAAYNGVAATLRALGDSKTPLYFLIMSSIINIILDLFFVLALNWGVFGVAFATIIAQAVSAIVCMIYAYNKVEYFRLTREQLQLNPRIILDSIKIGVPISLQNSMIAVSCMALQGVVNTFGETFMAGYTIVCKIEQIIQQPFSSLGTALTTYSGQNMGAAKKDRVKKGFCQATIMVLIYSVCLIPIAYLFGQQIIGIFVKEADVIQIGAKALRITSLCYFALGMIYVPRAVLNGCGDANFAMINGLTEVGCRVVFSQVLTRIPALGYLGIWLTTCATWVITAAVCVGRYFQEKWSKKALVKAQEVQ